MSVQKRGPGAWRVRWQEGDRWRSRTFETKADAAIFDGDLKRRRRLGTLADLDAGLETLDSFVTDTWAVTHAALLAPKTRRLYSGLYDAHLSPTLGSVPLRELTPQLIGRWQADRLAAGSGPVAIRKSLTLLGNVLQRAAESGRIPTNPARLVRKATLPRPVEVRPIAPATIEKMRAASSPRNAALISVLAYGGLRPGEALGLRWGDVRAQTLLVARSISMGTVKTGGKTGQRTVRLLGPLADDLAEWKMASGRPTDRELVFPGVDGRPWTEAAWDSWRKCAFANAVKASGIDHARPYDLRHSFASLLLHEGRNVIYVARQLGHSAALTLGTYGHVIDELDDAPQQDAESAILAARSTWAAPELPIAGSWPSAPA